MDKLTIGIIGAFQNGKSTLVNCLLGEKVAKTGGYGKSVTSINTKYVYGESSAAIVYSHDKIIGQYSLGSFVGEGAFESFLKEKFASVQITDITMVMPANILKSVNILDTPGFNANEHDTSMALASLDNMDFAILLVKNKGLSETEKIICQELSNKGKPFSLIMNCMDECDDMWNPSAEQNQKVANNILADFKMQNISPYSFGGEQIWITNLLWYWHSIYKGCYSAIEQKQTKRIICFFDLFFDCPSLSRKQLKEKSLFVQLKDALQNSKNLCAIGTFCILARSFELYKEIAHSKCTVILKELPYAISIKIRHLLECINRIRAEFNENEVRIEERKKQILKIHDMLYLVSPYGIVCAMMKGIQLSDIMHKREKMLSNQDTLAHEISTLEQRNRNIQMIEKAYLDSINYLKSIYNDL